MTMIASLTQLVLSYACAIGVMGASVVYCAYLLWKMKASEAQKKRDR
jgi:hypothetical protein